MDAKELHEQIKRDARLDTAWIIGGAIVAVCLGVLLAWLTSH